jgi:hypothetical protein
MPIIPYDQSEINTGVSADSNALVEIPFVEFTQNWYSMLIRTKAVKKRKTDIKILIPIKYPVGEQQNQA